MSGRITKWDWAPIQFPVRGRPEIADVMREETRRIYALQEDDDKRFTSAVTGLLNRLDLSTGALVAMTCDHRFVELFENWAASCDRAGIERRASTLVFTTDRDAFDQAEGLGFVAYFDDESALLADMGDSKTFGDREWTKYMFHQNWVIRSVLQLPVDLLFQDVDVVWRHDPLPTLMAEAQSGADIQAMYDGPNGRFQPLYANSGFMYFRNSQDVQAFWADVYSRHEMVAYYRSQQKPLNVMLAAYAHRGLDVRVLDEERFANGHLYCGGRTPPTDPWVVHNSWTGNLDEKLARYRANDLWFLGEPGGN